MQWVRSGDCQTVGIPCGGDGYQNIVHAVETRLGLPGHCENTIGRQWVAVRNWAYPVTGGGVGGGGYQNTVHAVERATRTV